MKITLLELNQMTQADFTATIGPVFEHSPWIAEKAWLARPFASLAELHEVLHETVRAAPQAAQEALIRAHPDLAGRLAQLGELTHSSTGEQAAAGLSGLTPEELETFDQKNKAYRAKFGFPFVICARLSHKQAILDTFDLRQKNDLSIEMKTALEEIDKIARLRLEELL